jgi:hypothetical protein
MKALRIVNWDRYETSDSKKCKVMQWVAVPINHDGLGFIEMVTRPDGIRMIGGWLLILQVAARCPTRGVLVADSGRILGSREIALKTRTPEDDIKRCIAALIEAGWIEEVDVSGRYPDVIRTTSGLQDRTLQDSTVQDKRQEPDGSEADSVGPLFTTREGSWRMSSGFRATLADLFPTAPLDVEIAKAAAWTEKTRKRKTAKGMHAFLTNWLARNYAQPPTPPNERPSDDAMAEAAELTAKLRAEGKLK